MTSLPVSVDNSPVVLVFEAGTDRGCALAHSLLAAGCRVVATDQHAASLVRISYGQSSDRLFLVAADATDEVQVQGVIDRARTHFGREPLLYDPCADFGQSSAA
ncbi:hypothetical protein [Mycolicibacterium sphagni]|uniref:Short-chain dehydrogenase n=1 Tax=Mycolicibacterium sphagni TaxID=1786 RepID=A0A255DJ78_9MYCO|nr:hypothetical protein [Mycolicibacterium sphagni]OYN77295.1 hypothetical protein CG716_19000 [Mycolicibacterium sphagni]